MKLRTLKLTQKCPNPSGQLPTEHHDQPFLIILPMFMERSLNFFLPFEKFQLSILSLQNNYKGNIFFSYILDYQNKENILWFDLY